jgi:hypothetical protein
MNKLSIDTRALIDTHKDLIYQLKGAQLMTLARSMTMKRVSKPRLCDYFGCNEPICEADKKFTNDGSWRLCEKHAKERDAFIETEDACGMVRWWAKSEYARLKAAQQS